MVEVNKEPRRRVVALLATALGAAAMLGQPVRRVSACQYEGFSPHTVDASLRQTDRTPPVLQPLSVVRLKRGHSESGAACSGSSCDDIGVVRIAVPTNDDMTAPSEMGYRLSIVAGSAPPSLVTFLPAEPVRLPAVSGEDLWLHWLDDESSLDFTLQVLAVDRAGNESGPRTLRIRDERDGGCRVAPLGPNGAAPLFAAGALAAAAGIAAARRRRRRDRDRAAS